MIRAGGFLRPRFSSSRSHYEVLVTDWKTTEIRIEIELDSSKYFLSQPPEITWDGEPFSYNPIENNRKTYLLNTSYGRVSRKVKIRLRDPRPRKILWMWTEEKVFTYHLLIEQPPQYAKVVVPTRLSVVDPSTGDPVGEHANILDGEGHEDSFDVVGPDDMREALIDIACPEVQHGTMSVLVDGANSSVGKPTRVSLEGVITRTFSVGCQYSDDKWVKEPVSKLYRITISRGRSNAHTSAHLFGLTDSCNCEEVSSPEDDPRFAKHFVASDFAQAQGVAFYCRIAGDDFRVVPAFKTDDVKAVLKGRNPDDPEYRLRSGIVNPLTVKAQSAVYTLHVAAGAERSVYPVVFLKPASCAAMTRVPVGMFRRPNNPLKVADSMCEAEVCTPDDKTRCFRPRTPCSSYHFGCGAGGVWLGNHSFSFAWCAQDSCTRADQINCCLDDKTLQGRIKKYGKNPQIALRGVANSRLVVHSMRVGDSMTRLALTAVDERSGLLLGPFQERDVRIVTPATFRKNERVRVHGKPAFIGRRHAGKYWLTRGANSVGGAGPYQASHLRKDPRWFLREDELEVRADGLIRCRTGRKGAGAKGESATSCSAAQVIESEPADRSYVVGGDFPNRSVGLANLSTALPPVQLPEGLEVVVDGVRGTLQHGCAVACLVSAVKLLSGGHWPGAGRLMNRTYSSSALLPSGGFRAGEAVLVAARGLASAGHAEGVPATECKVVETCVGAHDGTCRIMCPSGGGGGYRQQEALVGDIGRPTGFLGGSAVFVHGRPASVMRTCAGTWGDACSVRFADDRRVLQGLGFHDIGRPGPFYDGEEVVLADGSRGVVLQAAADSRYSVTFSSVDGRPGFVPPLPTLRGVRLHKIDLTGYQIGKQRVSVTTEAREFTWVAGGGDRKMAWTAEIVGESVRVGTRVVLLGTGESAVVAEDPTGNHVRLVVQDSGLETDAVKANELDPQGGRLMLGDRVQAYGRDGMVEAKVWYGGGFRVRFADGTRSGPLAPNEMALASGGDPFNQGDVVVVGGNPADIGLVTRHDSRLAGYYVRTISGGQTTGPWKSYQLQLKSEFEDARPNEGTFHEGDEVVVAGTSESGVVRGGPNSRGFYRVTLFEGGLYTGVALAGSSLRLKEAGLAGPGHQKGAAVTRYLVGDKVVCCHGRLGTVVDGPHLPLREYDVLMQRDGRTVRRPFADLQLNHPLEHQDGLAIGSEVLIGGRKAIVTYGPTSSGNYLAMDERTGRSIGPFEPTHLGSPQQSVSASPASSSVISVAEGARGTGERLFASPPDAGRVLRFTLAAASIACIAASVAGLLARVVALQHRPSRLETRSLLCVDAG